jgi:hypothetical protein
LAVLAVLILAVGRLPVVTEVGRVNERPRSTDTPDTSLPMAAGRVGVDDGPTSV